MNIKLRECPFLQVTTVPAMSMKALINVDIIPLYAITTKADAEAVQDIVKQKSRRRRRGTNEHTKRRKKPESEE